ncbi:MULTISPECIES: hypothetical protein [Actinomycetes]|uniref:hypothetical protein n=1 Tax=Actinomycetes TaxID=1760 RepID=UPI00069007D4|nr:MULTISPECIES: hypothetical protein [Actinomycetes]
MEPTIEYVFGAGDGRTSTWTSSADLTLGGRAPDAVRLDFDGDGLSDDALWDRDHDGRADCSALDLDDDGAIDAWFTDDGSGVWGKRSEGLAGAGPPDPPDPPRSPSPANPEEPSALSGERTFDGNADGQDDIAVSRTGGRLYIDTDDDGKFDQVLVDSDLNGVADSVAHPGPDGLTFDRYG